MLESAALLAGLVVGSFLNVCIVRVPRGESVITPSSHCRHCQAAVRWYDNIPLLSYALLGGRCRDCKEPIQLRYPLVEAATALLAFGLVSTFADPRQLLLFFALTSALVVVAFIDIDHRIIPDVITLPSILVAPAAAFFVDHISVLNSLVGVALGGGILWGVASLYALLRKREGMGLGDVKLLAMIGGILGWEAVLFTLLISSVGGALFGLALVVLRRGKMDLEIPFGPFLAAASVLYIFSGPALVGWYLAGGPLG